VTLANGTTLSVTTPFSVIEAEFLELLTTELLTTAELFKLELEEGFKLELELVLTAALDVVAALLNTGGVVGDEEEPPPPHPLRLITARNKKMAGVNFTC
jgi:hypothetical protein